MEIREKLASTHACYVLITCDAPSPEGNMNVEMSYEGDPALASLLVQGALDHLAEQEFEDEVVNTE